MPRASSRLTPVSPPTSVERTALPRLYLAGKSGVRYHAYVHCYVAGSPHTIRGERVTPLLYLSLVAAQGHGSALKGLWSSLVARHLEEISLDGLGRVALAHHVLPGQRWQLHWNYHQVALESGELHAMIEPQMLSVCDPMRAMAAAERSRQRAGSRTRGGRVEAATMSKKEETNTEETQLRLLFPRFLLLAPGSLQPRRESGEPDEAYTRRCAKALEHWRVTQHFTFLDPRYPFPLLPDWAEWLWQRGQRRGEIERLTTWSPAVEQPLPAQDSVPLRVPFFLEAWLCRPDPIQIKLDLDEAHARGELMLPRRPVALQAQEVHEEAFLVGSPA